MTGEKLLPCPNPFGICVDGEPILHRAPARAKWAVSCDCGLRVHGDDRAEAIAAWNARPSSPASTDADLRERVAFHIARKLAESDGLMPGGSIEPWLRHGYLAADAALSAIKEQSHG